MTTPRAWSADEQARLCAGLRAGVPPTRLCRDLSRSPADVHRRVTSLLGDPPGPTATISAADLDVLWLRMRVSDIDPRRPDAGHVVGIWESASGTALSEDMRLDLAADVEAIGLTGHSRHRLVGAARALVATAGMLDLDEWAAEVARADPIAVPEGPSSPSGIAGLRRTLEACIEDVTPDTAREGLRRHLLTPGRPGETHAPDVSGHVRWQGVVEVLRAAGHRGTPAATLRDALLTTEALQAFATHLGSGFSAAVTLGLLGGRHETEALRLAGRIHTRWTSPPSLGRGVRIRRPS